MRPRRSPKDSPQQVPAQAAAAQAEHVPAPGFEPVVPAQARGVEDVQDQIRRLANLRHLGVLTDEEFSGLTAVLMDLP